MYSGVRLHARDASARKISLHLQLLATRVFGLYKCALHWTPYYPEAVWGFTRDVIEGTLRLLRSFHLSAVFVPIDCRGLNNVHPRTPFSLRLKVLKEREIAFEGSRYGRLWLSASFIHSPNRIGLVGNGGV